MEELKKFFHLHYELTERVLLPTCSRLSGKEVHQFTAILDLKDISMTDLMSFKVKEMLGIASTMAQDYYPEIVHKTYIVNAPFLFSTFFNAIKGLLNARTQATLSVQSSSYQKELHQAVDPACLPAELGGTCKDPLINQNMGIYTLESSMVIQVRRWELTLDEQASLGGPYAVLASQRASMQGFGIMPPTMPGMPGMPGMQGMPDFPPGNLNTNYPTMPK